MNRCDNCKGGGKIPLSLYLWASPELPITSADAAPRPWSEVADIFKIWNLTTLIIVRRPIEREPLFHPGGMSAIRAFFTLLARNIHSGRSTRRSPPA